MPYRIAGVDVHKKMLAVAVADVDGEGAWRFDRRQFGTSPSQLRALAEWFTAADVEEVVMESTAQYWRPVWEALERHWQPGRRARPAGAMSGVASGAASVEERTTRPEAGLPRC
jgi:transposase